MRLGVLTGSVLPRGAHPGMGATDWEFGSPSSNPIGIEGKGHELVVIARHGLPPHIPPHRVNHKANVKALAEMGPKAVISVCSSGALSKDMDVPSLAVPEDYIDLFSGSTFHDDGIFHATPGFDEDLRESLIRSCGTAGMEFRSGGTYVQTMGPRLETRAEVRLLAGWGDYVGMNLGPEATLCCELGIPHAAVLTVDNMAHGLSDSTLDYRDILKSASSRWEEIEKVLFILCEEYG